jgi:hypothetical protein
MQILSKRAFHSSVISGHGIGTTNGSSVFTKTTATRLPIAGLNHPFFTSAFGWRSDQPCHTVVRNHRRYFSPFTKEEEEQEKARVSHLSKEEKDEELRSLNREISKLETLRGINTGELYTWSGRYKGLMRDYGFPLFVYYWCVWSVMGVSVYLAIDVGGLDAMELLSRLDHQFGWSLTEKVDPQMGKIGLALLVNEVMEPIRLPFVITTLKPAMDVISPPKY